MKKAVDNKEDTVQFLQVINGGEGSGGGLLYHRTVYTEHITHNVIYCCIQYAMHCVDQMVLALHKIQTVQNVARHLYYTLVNALGSDNVGTAACVKCNGRDAN